MKLKFLDFNPQVGLNRYIEISLIFLLLFAHGSVAQISTEVDKFIPKINPIPPSAFEFIKYAEIPVSEYSGVPQIQIPIYTITEKDFTFPLALSYHAGGIRVSEEASWVGLGWNLDVGNVTQIVNDRDDFDESFIKQKPDYYYYGYRYDFPWYHPYPWQSNNGPYYGFTPSTGITAQQPYHSFVNYMDYYIPVNGVYARFPVLLNGDGDSWDHVDSEPDIFKASFGGHTLEFIMDYSTFLSGEPIILNRKGFIVDKYTTNQGHSGWQITAPDGVNYYFEVLDELIHDNTTTYVRNVATGSGTQSVVSRTWHLTKIQTPENREITFTWIKSASISDMPSISQKRKYKKLQGQQGISCPQSFRADPIGGQVLGDEIIDGYTLSRNLAHTASMLEKITFTLGTIEFSLSDRVDIAGAKKVDAISILSFGRTVKSFVFSYDYFIGHTTGLSADEEYANYYNKKNNDEISKRLKLNSVIEDDMPPYSFVYNNAQLPVKTSYATDYWGYYNGKTSNTSLIPNPVHIGESVLGDNGNDHRSDIVFARAGMLEQFIYPTKGSTQFEYALHVFDNSYFTPGLSSGGGLRIENIINFDDRSQHVSKTHFEYDGGKLMNPPKFSGKYNYDITNESTVSWNFNVTYISGESFYSSSLLGSGSHIGYGKVTKTNLDLDDNTNGEIVSYFSNNPDIGAYDEIGEFSLPARKNHLVPSNGSLLKQETKNSNGVILETNNDYSFVMSDVYYGARLGGSNMWLTPCNPDGNQITPRMRAQNVVGYYPIYSGETILNWTETIEHSSANVVAKTIYGYNDNRVVQSSTSKNSKGEEIAVTYEYPCNSGVLYSQMCFRNILNKPVKTITTRNGNSLHSYWVQYLNFHGSQLPASVHFQTANGTSRTKVVFDDYNTKGNVIKFHKDRDVTTSYVYGYNSELPLAEAINANPDEIAFSDFENDDDKGGWTYVTSTSTISKTGLRAFTGSSITKSNIPSGNYTISFWAKRNTINGTVSGTVAATITSDTWTYYQLNFSGTSVSLALNNVSIDGLRLHPSDAVMTTFTHIPLVGITSKTDGNGQVTYFEYDSDSGRLLRTRDNNKFLLNVFDYNFKD